MIINTTDSHLIRTVIIYCSITCIYLLLYVFILIYTDNIYKIGKYKCFPLLMAIMLAETVKFTCGLLVNNVSFGSRDTKYTKIKKYCSKIKVKELFKCMSVMFGATGILYLIAVLFGAPLFSECEETFMFSALLISLTVYASCLNVGADSTLLLLIGMKPAISNIVTEMLLKNIQVTLIGSWLGAVVIPLDWDRPWQVWPIPCCLGGILGCFVSHIITLTKLMPHAVRVFACKNVR